MHDDDHELAERFFGTKPAADHTVNMPLQNELEFVRVCNK